MNSIDLDLWPSDQNVGDKIYAMLPSYMYRYQVETPVAKDRYMTCTNSKTMNCSDFVPVGIY